MCRYKKKYLFARGKTGATIKQLESLFEDMNDETAAEGDDDLYRKGLAIIGRVLKVTLICRRVYHMSVSNSKAPLPDFLKLVSHNTACVLLKINAWRSEEARRLGGGYVGIAWHVRIAALVCTCTLHTHVVAHSTVASALVSSHVLTCGVGGQVRVRACVCVGGGGALVEHFFMSCMHVGTSTRLHEQGDSNC